MAFSLNSMLFVQSRLKISMWLLLNALTPGLFYGLPFEAAIGHHRILGRAFVLIQLIHILFVYVLGAIFFGCQDTAIS